MYPRIWLCFVAVGLALSWSAKVESKPLPVVQIAIIEVVPLTWCRNS